MGESVIGCVKRETYIKSPLLIVWRLEIFSKSVKVLLSPGKIFCKVGDWHQRNVFVYSALKHLWSVA